MGGCNHIVWREIKIDINTSKSARCRFVSGAANQNSMIVVRYRDTRVCSCIHILTTAGSLTRLDWFDAILSQSHAAAV